MFNAQPKKSSPAGAILQAMAKVWGWKLSGQLALDFPPQAWQKLRAATA
jgi:hypothetical protein